MYEFHSRNLPRVFGPLPDSIAAALGIRTLEPATRAAVELEEQGQVL